MSDHRPNITVVMADQLAAAFLPCYGHPVVHAPHLTALARSGTTFASAYCASPLCAPSRSAMLAGRRASALGVYDNAAELPASVPTIAHLLRAGGYDTVLAGKMHFVGPDQLHGFEERLTTDVYPAGFDWTPDWRLPSGTRLPWYHNMSGVLDAGVREAAMQTAYDDEVCFRAVERIRELAQRPDRRPFFLVVSFTNPHDPWEVRARHWEIYRDRPIDPPAVPRIPRSEADPHSLRLRDMSGMDEHPLTDAQVAHARRAYYAAVSSMDERVGEVLGALREHGLGGRDDRRVHRRPRRDGRRAGAVVQDVLPRGLRPGAAARRRPRHRPRRGRRGPSRTSIWRPRWPIWRVLRPARPSSRAEASRRRSQAATWRRGRSPRSTWPRA